MSSANPATQSPASPLPSGANPVHLNITAPADETVVTQPQVDVVGQAPSDTVVTVNDLIVVVDATGQFSVTVPLQEGPNELDITASDPAGDETSSRLFVTYELPN